MMASARSRSLVWWLVPSDGGLSALMGTYARPPLATAGMSRASHNHNRSEAAPL